MTEPHPGTIPGIICDGPSRQAFATGGFRLTRRNNVAVGQSFIRPFIVTLTLPSATPIEQAKFSAGGLFAVRFAAADLKDFGLNAGTISGFEARGEKNTLVPPAADFWDLVLRDAQAAFPDNPLWLSPIVEVMAKFEHLTREASSDMVTTWRYRLEDPGMHTELVLTGLRLLHRVHGIAFDEQQVRRDLAPIG